VDPAPSVATLFLIFAKIGLSSFGGGLSAWVLREFVQKRRWLSEDEFLSGLALAQSFPGVNIVNLSIWIGFRMRGTPGALAGATGIVLPPAITVIVIALAFSWLSRFPEAHLALDGVGAAAIGLSLSVGVLAGRRAAKGLVPVAIMAASFAGVGLLNLPIPLVVLALAPLSVFFAYRRLPPVE
jgi:chromate transporter